MEPTIYKPSIYKGAGIYKTDENNTDIGENKLNSVYVTNTTKGFSTQNINIEDATIIEENIVFKAMSFSPGVTFNLSGGQWYSGTMSKFIGIAVYLYADKIEFDFSDNDPLNIDIITGITYDLNNIVRKNIIYNRNNDIATCKIYYDDSLVCTYTKNISDIYLDGNRSYSLLSNRQGELVDIGYIDVNKSYILIDGETVWGIYNKNT